MSALCLGLDSSTQSLTAVVLDAGAQDPSSGIVHEVSLRFDQDLAHWGTENGQLPSADPTVGVAPPLMWVEALDLLFAQLSSEVDLRKIQGLAVSAQQHGSVYLNAQAPGGLAQLLPGVPLISQIAPLLARQVAPLWTDCSTARQCREIRTALGGSEAAARQTGSDIYERFTAPQIRRFACSEPQAWKETRHVALVSSFVTSLLLGRIAPIDWGDAAGTNLLDIRGRCWSKAAIAATADDLELKLPKTCAPHTELGSIAPYFSQAYGLPSDAKVMVGTGDNPSSALGVGLLHAGDAVLSLGTSDTLSSLADQLPSLLDGHIFVAPSGHDLGLLCFRNGSLAREQVRDAFGIDWKGFERAVAASPPANSGHTLLPWVEPEIVPRTVGQGIVYSSGFPRQTASVHCRAILEGQALAMLRHAQGLQPIRQLRVTGGASASDAMLQIMADVFGCAVQSFESPNGAALGAALRAARCMLDDGPWQTLVANMTAPSGRGYEPQCADAYASVKEQAARLEQKALRTRAAPAG